MINGYWEKLGVSDPGRYRVRVDQNCRHCIANPKRLLELERSSKNAKLPRRAEIRGGPRSAELAG